MSVVLTFPWGHRHDASTKCFTAVSRRGDVPPQEYQHHLFLAQRDTTTLSHQHLGSPSGGQRTLTGPSGANACATDPPILSAPQTLGFEEQDLGNWSTGDALVLKLTSCLPVTLSESESDCCGPCAIKISLNFLYTCWSPEHLLKLCPLPLLHLRQAPFTFLSPAPTGTPETPSSLRGLPSPAEVVQTFTCHHTVSFPLLHAS